MDRVRRALEALDAPPAWRRLRWALVAGSIAVGALDAWFTRQWNVNPDGISYIDLARAFVAHGPNALISGYWSPLLPTTIGGALALFTPAPDSVYPLVRGVMFLVFVACVAGFDRFVGAAIPPALPARWMRPLLLVSAWALFFLLGTQAMGLHLVTPDFGVAAIAFWVAAELVALEQGPWSAWRWVRLGAVLGVGYWWKAILFPASGVAIACAAWIALRRRDGVRGPARALATFGFLALLLAIPVSRHVQRATFGETGRLNQVWYVQHGTSSLSLCLAADARIPVERAGEITLDERVLDHPLTCRMRYEWPEATMPLWYDPSSWYRQAKAIVRPAETLAAVRTDAGYIAAAIADIAPLAGIALAIALVVAVATRAGPGPWWPVVAFAAVPIAFYLVVYVELRHVTPFLLILALGALVSIATRGGRAAALALSLVAVATTADAVRRLVTQQRVEAAITVHELLRHPRPEQLSVRVAHALAARGLAAGDRVATINTLWNVDWAHRAGLVVRAYVPEYTYPIDRTLAELADPCGLERFDTAMRGARIKGVVLREVPRLPSPPGWDTLDDTGYRLRLVPASAAPHPACTGP